MRLEDMREQFPKMPESMKQMIEHEVAVQIGQEKENNNPKVVTYKKRKKKNMAHRMLVASMVAALALATTVCAGVAYQMHNEKVGKYGLKTQIEGPQTVAESTENMADQTTEESAGKAAEYVRLETSYLPKGMVQSEEGKYSFEDNYMQGGVSMTVYQLTPGETIADIENTGIAVSEETNIGGRPAVYMETASAESNSAENSSTEGTSNENTSGAKKIYMIYAEHNYLLEMFIFPDVTKEEAFQIAEGVSVTPTEETSGENVMQVCSWNDMENEAGKGEPETLMTFPKGEMKNVHLIGGEISLDQNGIEATPGLTAIVSGVTISDNISSLSENMLADDTKAAFDTDGNLLPMKVEYLKSGDGINTVDEVVETKEIPMKIVSVTVDYKNNGKTALSNVMFNGGIALLAEHGENMQFDAYMNEKPGTGDTWDCVNEESIGFSQEVYLSDVHGGERHNNYINTINPGETVTVRMAFKVPEEKLNEMYFTLSNYGGSHFYDETSLQLGYVDIRQ
jgi:hypothetical protein